MSSEVLTSPLPCPSNWRLVRLKHICTKIGSGATPTGGQAAYQEHRSNYALVRSQNVFDREFSSSGLAFISDEQASSLRSAKLEPDDILLNITGDGVTFGRACLVPADVLPACVNQHVSIVRLDRNQADPGYVLSYFTHPLIKGYIESFNAGGSRRAITKGHIESFVLPLPSLAEQESIAETLGTFDDRIALLRETNATLEAIAQALFKSWFVDFDPVHARARGEQPAGLTPEVTALFPDCFEESALGMIPKGWRVGCIGHLGEVVCGKTPPTSDPDNYGEDVPFITIPDMHGYLAVTSTARSLSRKGADSQPKKYLPAGSICVSCIATPGLVVQVTESSHTNQQINSVIPHLEWGRSFPLFLLRRIGDKVRAGGSGGSVFHNLSKSSFEKIPELLPTNNLAQQYCQIVDPLVEKIIDNQRQAQTLATLRDTLLPRLISGQLRLPDAEQQLKDLAV
ncbi:restriction endonuclease subunit S [Aeromonas salmonicida]|uniref:restriction endonuclease subunit S n=1 Tax=Aeromonas salmonicida TaxID=645 RepID=UPI0038D17858